LNMDHILDLLDADRALSGDISECGDVVRCHSPGECTIMYSTCFDAHLNDVIAREKALADSAGYQLEWKTYGHDKPADLRQRLTAAGFVAEDVEAFMVLPLTPESVAQFPVDGHDIRRIDSVDQLRDLTSTAESSAQGTEEEEWRRLEPVMREDPESMSVYVAYVDGRPVGGGRIQYNGRPTFAGLYGGRTDPAFRKQGHYIALLGARLREAYERGIEYAFIDALPPSAPIVEKRGFVKATDTQPFVWGG